MKTVIVKMGEIHATHGACLLETFGVGSCVVVVLYDSEAEVAGMMHAMLTRDKATTTQIQTNPLRYVELAVPALINEMTKAGAHKSHLKACVAGGAQMFSLYRDASNTIGQKNVASALQLLTEHNIPIVLKNIGGTEGRNVHFDCATGTCAIETKSSMEAK